MSSEDHSRTSPFQLTKLLPSRPLFSVDGGSRRGAIVQHYRHPPGCIAVEPLRDHLLVVNLSGQVLIEDARTRGRWERRWAGGGQMSLTPAGMAGTRVLKGRPEVLLVHLPPSLVRQTATEIGLRPEHATLVPRLAVADEVVERLGRLLLAVAPDPEAGASMMLDALTRALVVHLLRNHSIFSPEKAVTPSSSSGGRIQRVIDHMQVHMDERLPLSSLAGLSGLSPSQFARTFRAAVGKPPHGYLLDLRIERARNLLENTDLPVIEVGMQCGFEQPNHFATMFRKIVGFSPRAWRAARRM
jgi:AraC family transcriptional regulator